MTLVLFRGPLHRFKKHFYFLFQWHTILQKNFRAYIKAGGDAGWQFIVFPWNEHQIEEARQRSLDEGFATFSLVQTVRNTGASIEGGRDNKIVNIADLNLSQEGVTGGRLKDGY